MAKKTPPVTIPVKSVNPSFPLRPPAVPSIRLKSRISAKSVEKAKSAFSKFTLSKFAAEPPPNYVTTKRSLAAAHKDIVAKTINILQNSQTNRSMTVALPPADIKKLLPSFDSTSGHVQLDDVLRLVEQGMRGREFYARGNPTLNRLSVEASAQQILNAFKKEVKK